MNKRHLILTFCAAFGFTAGFVRGAERFDHTVREMFFAGFAGNTEQLEKGMATCDQVLKENAKHAEALVWRGSGYFFLAGQAFQKGDAQKGMELSMRGIGEMDRAVELEPDNIGVRVPRAAVLMSAATQMKGPQAKMFAQRAVADYEHTMKLQQASLDKLGTHPRGELLQGLANGYRVLGETEKAKAMFARLEAEMPGTPYAKRAAKFRETGSLEPRDATCIGCHVKQSE
jgi:tetratricopeptide (TPR) repeat protein